MRLLITTDPIGGVWTFTAELTEQLLQREHTVHLVSFGRKTSSAQDGQLAALKANYPSQFGFTMSEIALEWMQDNAEILSQGDALLRDLVGQHRPDLLFSNQFCFGAFTGSVPRVVAAHSDVLSWARAAKPSALEGTPWLNRYTALVQGGLMQADAVTAPTQSVLRGLKNSFFLPNNGIVIPNGRTQSHSTQKAPASRRLQAVIAGRLWDEAKGLGILAETALPLPVLLAGETSDKGPSDAQPLPGVKLLGQLAPEALQALYRESAIYLCPSLYEPFGLAPLEAALNGCALVCRDLPSLREVWGDAALYFRSAAEMTAQLTRLAGNPGLLADAQARAEAHARQYTPERMTEAYLSIFTSVLAAHRAAGQVAPNAV